ncbi:MAG: fumarate hydratase [Spirochaetaceae bacterium]|jgi:fumarate hydratase class I|nr:fumarate hydratase [Spirochaetaceae bacterium]
MLYLDTTDIIAQSFHAARFDTLPCKEKPSRKGNRLFIPPRLLHRMAEEAFHRLAFYLRRSHLDLLAERYHDPQSSANDRFVLRTLLENAGVACKGELALCQDTGTVVIYGWKDEAVYTGGDDAKELAEGALDAYQKHHLRASQVGASSFFDEYNTATNAPVQIKLHACAAAEKRKCYRFLFIAKGGGSSNKTAFFSLSKASLEEEQFSRFLDEQIKALGTNACPPYRLAVVVGGTSPEYNLELLKLATTEILDYAPYDGNAWIRRDRYWEERIMEKGRQSGLGAQFGGTNLLLDARVLRLPRHAASCPVSIGVSCVAHRNLLGVIDSKGIHLERLCTTAPQYPTLDSQSPPAFAVNLAPPLSNLCRQLSQFSVGDRLLLSGELLVARDAAHYEWHRRLKAGQTLPDYLYRYAIFYAGPSERPPGKIIGSVGPTTAGRMDRYAEAFLSAGVSLVTVAKGARNLQWVDACRRYGGFYLGTVGGAAALMAEQYITKDTIIDYPELGMEAVRLISVHNLPAVILIAPQATDAG